jgi:hypothetical protein
VAAYAAKTKDLIAKRVIHVLSPVSQLDLDQGCRL